jgi:hypothetical protein
MGIRTAAPKPVSRRLSDNDFICPPMSRVHLWQKRHFHTIKRSDPRGTSGVHFFTTVPASCATAAKVVCAAFKPRRKSLSEYAAYLSVG